MKRKYLIVFSLILTVVMTGVPVCQAATPAEGFDPADGKYVKAESQHYWEGRYSDGRVFPEYLAKELSGDFDNLENYAVGGAFTDVLTGSVEEGTDRSNWSTWLKGWGGIEQTERFIEDKGGKVDPDALYVISAGANDSYVVSTLGLEQATQKSAANLMTMVDNLANAGATDFILMLQVASPGKTEDEFTKAHRAATQKAADAYLAEHKEVNLALVDLNGLFRDMEKQGQEAYGYKTWGFYQISDWVPAYGYVYAADDNSSLLPNNAAEDIYGYGYYYSKDGGYYYTPEAAGYAVDEFFYYDEYHLTSKSHMHIATYLLDADITTDEGTFEKVYDGAPSAFAASLMAEKTYANVYTFGDSTIDSGKALEVTSELVADREKQSVSIRDMKDCQEKSWYATYVNYALQTGLMSGTGTDTFSPNEPMTRGQLVAVLGRAAGVESSSADNPAETIFGDVNPNAYYASHIAWAVENGIVSGAGTEENPVFLPDSKISRQDMAKIIGAYAEVCEIALPEPKGDFTFDDDSEIRDYAKSYVYQLNEAGILQGSNNAFHPEDMTTRAAATTVLAKLLNN